MTFMPHYVPTIKRIMESTSCEERVARAAFELYRDNIDAAIEWANLFTMQDVVAKLDRAKSHA
jgi:hypothetical protein